MCDKFHAYIRDDNHAYLMSDILQSYREAWKCCLLNWRVLFLLYACNLAIAFVALGPFSNLVESVFGRSLMLGDFTSRFDYTAIIDMINEHGLSLNLSIATCMSFFIVYTIWTIFYTGGIVEIVRHKNTRSSTLLFWKGGAELFFRYLRLTVYVLIIALLILTIAALFFTKDGLNPLSMDSESFLIRRFKLLGIIIIIFYFLLALFRDIAKVAIGYKKPKFLITEPIRDAFVRTFALRYIILGLINLSVLGLGLLLYFLLKNFMDDVWAVIIISQLFLIYRLAYRVVRLASISCLYERFEKDKA